jgi:hypothetical protein
MLPGSHDPSKEPFLKLENAFNEIFGKPGATPGREPDGLRFLHPSLDLAFQEAERED